MIHTLPSSNDVHNSGSFAFFCLPLAGGQEKSLRPILAILLVFFQRISENFFSNLHICNAMRTRYVPICHTQCVVTGDNHGPLAVRSLVTSYESTRNPINMYPSTVWAVVVVLPTSINISISFRVLCELQILFSLAWHFFGLICFACWRGPTGGKL